MRRVRACVQALAQQPAVLTYVPLLHALQQVPGGTEMLKDVRHECTAAVASSIAKLLSTRATDTERRVAAACDTAGAPPAHTPCMNPMRVVIPRW